MNGCDLIASAIAGRAVTVHWHTKKNLSSYTDGQSIYLPSQEAGVDQNFQIIAQALLIRTGALETRILQRLVGRRSVASRYIYAEICRASKEFQEILPAKFLRLPNLARFKYQTTSIYDSLRLAESAAVFPPIPDFIGSIRTLFVLKAAIPNTLSLVANKQNSTAQRPSPTPTPRETEDTESRLKLFDNPLFSGSAIAEVLNKILFRKNDGRSEQISQSGAGSEMKLGTISRTKKKGIFTTLAALATDLVASEHDRYIKYKSYPEWNVNTQAYRPDWTLVDEVDPCREDSQSNQVFHNALPSPPRVLIRKLMGIGLDLERHDGQQDGEDYSLDKVVDFASLARMGFTADDRVFVHRKRTRRDLAVMVLLDISGSTNERDGLGHSIHDKQVQLAHDLSFALHRLGDQVSLYAFQSWGRKLVRMLRIKSFKEQRWGSNLYDRLSCLEPAGFTRSGAAIRHASRKLKEEAGMPYCILIVITDGFSYDLDYEGRYGEQDTRKALEEIRRDGVGCLCLTVGSPQEEEKLVEVYGPASTLSVCDYDQFLENLRPAMLSTLNQVKHSFPH